MAALALDQGEGKHPPGRRPPAGPLEAPVGTEGASWASWPSLRFPPFDLPTHVASFRVGTTAHRAPCLRAPPPWAGPGRLSPPAGGARPGAAPGSWPHMPRPLPAPCPPSSTPGVGDPEARRAWGRSPESPSSTLPPPALLPLPAAPHPLSPPAVRSRSSCRAPPGALCPRRWQGRARPRRRTASLRADSLDLRLSAVFFPRTGSEGAAGAQTRPPPERPGPARERPLLDVRGPCPVPSGNRPPTVRPPAHFFLMRTAVY